MNVFTTTLYFVPTNQEVGTRGGVSLSFPDRSPKRGVSGKGMVDGDDNVSRNFINL